MPKVTYPLLSGKAAGRIGKDIIFYGEGFVRSWDVQTDPQTSPQMQFRTVVRELMQMIKISDGLDRAWLRKNYAKSWHTKLTSWLTRDQLANGKTLHGAWFNLSEIDRAAWESVVPGE
jgi:hypothetical protein